MNNAYTHTKSSGTTSKQTRTMSKHVRDEQAPPHSRVSTPVVFQHQPSFNTSCLSTPVLFQHQWFGTPPGAVVVVVVAVVAVVVVVLGGELELISA